MFELDINTEEMKKEALKITKDMGLLFSDMRDMFKGFDGELSEQLLKNFKKEGPGWDDLAESTQKARANRWGYYKKGGKKGGKAHPIGQWTGKMMRRAKSKGKALRKSYTKTFGKRDAIRMRLEAFHLGRAGKGKRAQPPRPIYRQRKVEKLLSQYANKWYTGLTKAFEKFDNVDYMKRIAGRFSG